MKDTKFIEKLKRDTKKCKNCPVLFIWGDFDGLCFYCNLRREE